MTTPQRGVPLSNETPVQRAPNRYSNTSSPIAAPFIHSPIRVSLGGRASMGGWLPASSGTPFKVDVANFLDSGKKFSSSDPDDYVTELRALHAELQEEVFKLSVDDWMYPRTEYLN